MTPFIKTGVIELRNQSYYGNNIISEYLQFCNGISSKNTPENSELFLKNFQLRGKWRFTPP